MVAGVRMARRCAERGGLTETMFAEWLISAPESLWYLQAADWANNPPDILKDERARIVFRQGCELIVKIVDLGYDEASGEWWSLRKLWPTDADASVGILILMDTATMLEQLKDIPIWPEEAKQMDGLLRAYYQPSFLIASAGFWVFFSLVCGPRWRQRFAAMMQATKAVRFEPTRTRRRGR